jgi:hypothetical protein
MSVIAPRAPINTLLPMEFTHHTLFVVLHCKGSSLVAVVQAKPYRESSRVFAQALEVVSEIGELLYSYLAL